MYQLYNELLQSTVFSRAALRISLHFTSFLRKAARENPRLSVQRKLMPDTVGSGKHKPASLRGTAKVTAHDVVGAEASTTEEPREGKLHAGICAGAA